MTIAQERRQQELTQAQAAARAAVTKASADIPTLRQEFMAWVQAGSDWLKQADSAERELLQALDSLVRAARNSLGQAANEGVAIRMEADLDGRVRELFGGIAAFDAKLRLLPSTKGASEWARDLTEFMAKHVRAAYDPALPVLAQFRKTRLVRMLEQRQRRQ